MFFNTNLTYPILLIMSNGKRSFENMGRTIGKSGDTVRRMLRSTQENHENLRVICKNFFKNTECLFVVIDDTLNRVRLEVRMHSNRKVVYNNKH